MKFVKSFIFCQTNFPSFLLSKTLVSSSPPLKHSSINPMKLSSIEASFNPYGLKALLVDHNPPSLLHLSKMLQVYHYQVTLCRCPREALSLIRGGECKFDIVISGVDFSSDMNGVQLLEIIGRETDLPVVIVSADDRKDTIIECVKKGACAYIPQPVTMEDLQLLWQHVARKEILRFKQMKQIDSVENDEPDSSNCGKDKDFCGSSDGGQVLVDRRRKDREDEQEKVERKKQRLVWTSELHQQFLVAVEQLGINKAVPKKVLELMNVPWLTRENVASHLQKYRLNLKKQRGHVQEISIPVSGVSIGACNSVLSHNDELLFQTTPLINELQAPDHYHMDLESNPVLIPNDRFHEPDIIRKRFR